MPIRKVFNFYEEAHSKARTVNENTFPKDYKIEAEAIKISC